MCATPSPAPSATTSCTGTTSATSPPRPSALRSIANPVYLGAGDYAHWLDQILRCFPEEQVLLVPFQASTDDDGAVLDVILNRLGLPAMDEVSDDAASTHRNDVVAFKSDFAHRIVKLVKNNPAYPKFRSLVGGERIRKVRSALTKEAPRESLDEALATCTDEHAQELDALTQRRRTRP